MDKQASLNSLDEPALNLDIPEKKLLSGLLFQAICDFHGLKDQERNAARSWFESTSTEEFTFAWILRELDLDIEPVIVYGYIKKIHYSKGSLLVPGSTHRIRLRRVNPHRHV